MDALTLWLLNGEGGIGGIASETMVRHIMNAPWPPGVPPNSPSFPWDSGDLRRCRLLVEQVPQIAEGLERMRTASPIWARIIDHWADLCRVMDEEAPDWREPYSGERAPRTNRMLMLIRRGEVPS